MRSVVGEKSYTKPKKASLRDAFFIDQRRKVEDRSLLLCAHGRLLTCAARCCGGLAEEVVVVQRAVEFAGDLGGFGAVGGSAALEKDHGHNVSDLGVGVGGEPAEAGAVFRAGAGLAQDLLFTKVETQAAGGAVLNGAHHALGDLRNQRADFKLALDARLKVDDIVCRERVLEVIERAAVGDGGDQRAELQRRHGDAFTKGAHLAYAAEPGCELVIGEGAQVFTGDVEAGKLAQSELVGVMADLGETKTAADRLK